MSRVEEVEEETTWEETLRRMLPEGAPLPDEEHLDYSIAVQYEGPPLPYSVPRVNPIDVDSESVSRGRMNARFNRVPLKDFKVKSSSQNSQQQSHQNSPSRDYTTDEYSSPRSRATDAVDGQEKPNCVEKSSKKKKKRGGVCNRCGKKSRIKEREDCLVCDAKYCGNCLIKAMGSMPEGRKCVGCIGKPIDESKRCNLGKSSKILCRVCSPLEVKQIMKAEKECAANQLRPEQLIVNGKQLNQDELAELLGCPLPPLKLKPGKYWYDKDSGLWGKVNKCFL